MSINERLNPPLWIAKNGITPLPTIYGWADANTGEMLCRVKDIPDPDLSYIFNAKQRKMPPGPVLNRITLSPTGATESTDGIYQRFTYDGLRVTYIDLMGEEGNPARYGWSAELPVNRIGNALAVNLKMPDLSGNKSANVFIADQTAEEITSGVLSREIFGGTSGYNYISLELRPDQGGVTLNVYNATDPFNPVVLPLNNNVLDGDPIAVNLVGSNVIVEHGGASQEFILPTGFFTGPNLPNVVAFSFGPTTLGSAEMSIRVDATTINLENTL